MHPSRMGEYLVSSIQMSMYSHTLMSRKRKKEKKKENPVPGCSRVKKVGLRTQAISAKLSFDSKSSLDQRIETSPLSLFLR